MKLLEDAVSVGLIDFRSKSLPLLSSQFTPTVIPVYPYCHPSLPLSSQFTPTVIPVYRYSFNPRYSVNATVFQSRSLRESCCFGKALCCSKLDASARCKEKLEGIAGG